MLSGHGAAPARPPSSSTTTACCSTPSRSGPGPSRTSSSAAGSSSPRPTSASWSAPRPRSPAASSSGGSGEPGRAAELIEELNELVVAELEHGVEAMVGARELLHDARRRGTPIGLVSNSPLVFVRALARDRRLRGSLRRRRQRPRSRGAEAGARSLPRGLPAPRRRAGSRVVALEDSPTGVAAARAAGLTVIGIPSIEGVALEEAHHIAGQPRSTRSSAAYSSSEPGTSRRAGPAAAEAPARRSEQLRDRAACSRRSRRRPPRWPPSRPRRRRR